MDTVTVEQRVLTHRPSMCQYEDFDMYISVLINKDVKVPCKNLKII